MTGFQRWSGQNYRLLIKYSNNQKDKDGMDLETFVDYFIFPQIIQIEWATTSTCRKDGRTCERIVIRFCTSIRL